MRPVYIICADNGTQDKDSNLVSLFNLTEKISLSARVHQKSSEDGKSDKPSVVMGSVRFHVVASWMKDPGDENKDFEARFRIEAPGKTAMEFAPSVFQIPEDKYMKRVRFLYEGPPFFNQQGILRFISEVREVGAPEWISQDYPVVVEVTSDLSGMPMAELVATTEER